MPVRQPQMTGAMSKRLSSARLRRHINHRSINCVGQLAPDPGAPQSRIRVGLPGQATVAAIILPNLNGRGIARRGLLVVTFSSRDDIQRWLIGRGRGAPVVLAVRAALRALPLLETSLRSSESVPDFAQSLVLPLFRGLNSVWIAVAHPSALPQINLEAAAVAADAVYGAGRGYAHSSRTAVGFAAAAAARSVARGDTNAPGYAADAVYAAAVASSSTSDPASIYAATSSDATELASEHHNRNSAIRLSDLAIQPLWPTGTPPWVTLHWERLKSALATENKDWWVWTGWYEARLIGGSIDHNLEVARVRIPEEVWRAGPRRVNAEIARLIARDEQPSAEQGWSFFLSYSASDEAYARWIWDLLNNAGYLVFSQFSNIPPGSNFVREIQHGLTKSDRLIALLSNDYEKSDHCQAEWAAGYNADSGGRTRKLVPLLIRPANLNPLAKQIVYRHLIGLSPLDAAAAILEAIGHTGPFPTIPSGWPGDAIIDHVKATTGGTFDVGPGPDGLLERKPISANTVNETGLPPEQLFADMARQFEEFVGYTEEDKRNYRCSVRLKNRARNLHKTSVVGFSQCDALALNRDLVWVLQTIALDMKDGIIPPNEEIDFYVRDLYGQYNLLPSIFPQLKRYREFIASRKFVPPSHDDDRAIHDIYRAFGTYEVAKGALSQLLSQELKQAGAELEQARKIAESSPGEAATALSVESHAEAATKGLGVWGWLANAREKFERGGKKSAELEKTIEGYEKLYNRISPQMVVYIDYLLKWFF